MKRYILVTVTIALLSLVGGCSSPTPEATATPTSEPATVSPELGMQMARQMGCTACHSIDGNPNVGPTWKGLFGSEQPLTDGSTVLADEAYVRESILDPNAEIVDGFLPGIMPNDFRNRLSDPEVQSIIEYIKTLR